MQQATALIADRDLGERSDKEKGFRNVVLIRILAGRR
jgi:hypothetical protein